jgi:hypothetical protein
MRADHGIPFHYYIYFSLIPNPLPVLCGGGLTALSLLSPCFPSAASLSKKSCQSSANDSLLLEELAMSMGSAADAAELRDGVLGVRLKGDMGMRSPPVMEAVPGRARPACSFCSADYQNE